MSVGCCFKCYRRDSRDKFGMSPCGNVSGSVEFAVNGRCDGKRQMPIPGCPKFAVQAEWISANPRTHASHVNSSGRSNGMRQSIRYLAASQAVKSWT